MKRAFHLFIAVLAVAASAIFATHVQADAVYPITNPTYIPTAISPAQTFSAPSSAYTVTLQEKSVMGVDFRGTCTSLAAAVQITVDGSNWSTVNAYPVVTTTSTPTASITAVGSYRANVSGAKAARVNITGLSANCAVSATGTNGALTTQ